MALNCAEIDVVLEELNLKGAFLQKISQPDFETLQLEFYQPGQKRFPVGIFLKSGETRLHALSQRITSTLPKPQRFVQLLRSRIDGGKVEECFQIQRNRLILLELTKGSVKTFLYIRLWTAAANVIAVDEQNRIIDCFFRRPKRGETSGQIFQLPPPPAEERLFTPRILEGEGSYSERLEFLYSQKSPSSPKPPEELLQPLLIRLQQSQKNLALLEKNSPSLQEAEKEKEFAELLNAQPFQSAGKNSITITHSWISDQPLTIPLDPKCDLRENAALYFKRYKKKKAAIEHFQNRKEEILQEIQKIQEKIQRIERLSPEQIKEELTKSEKKPNEKKAPEGIRSFRSGNHLILVGRNDKENDRLLRSHVKGNDWWFHTRDVPGGYVFVKLNKKEELPQEVLLDAAQLTLWFSKAKNHGSADLYSTQVKHLRRVQNGPLGRVLPFHEKNIFVREDKERLKRLLGRDFY